MPQILAVTVPFFALVLCGWLAARAGVLPDSAIPGLNAFVLCFALPCMLFRFGRQTPLGQLLDPVVLGVYTVVALAIVAGTVALTRSPQVHLKDAAFGALVAAFPNTGFMGVPLLAALLGPSAAGPVISTMLVDMVLTSSLCIALAQAHEASGQGARAAGLKALRGVVANPLPWAIALGAAAGAGGLALPGPAEAVVRMLADAATPVALFTIGAVLCRAGRHTHTHTHTHGDGHGHGRTPVARYLPVALVKLLVHPALVWALGRGAQLAGLPLADAQLTALTLAAALPSASSVSMLAERYGADDGRIARIILSSTVLAFVSFSLLAGALGAG